MPKNSKTKPNSESTDKLLKASFKAGHASGRLEAIEESMDAVAALIFKAEALQASLGQNADPAIHENSRHTLQALYLAFAAVTGAVNGSAAFRDLLGQSKQRLCNDSPVKH